MPIFHLLFYFMWSSNKVLKTLKYSEQYIRDHLSGTRVRVWIGSEYDAVFSFSCIASCNLNKTFTFSYMPFSSRIRPGLFKQSTCSFYAFEILFFKVFINVCKLTGKMPIDWSIFLGLWHSVNSLLVSLTDWNLSWSSIHFVCL